MKSKVAVLSLLLIATTTITSSALNLVVNGALMKDAEPKIIKSRTFVPVASIATATAANVGWDQASKTVIIQKDDVELKIKIGAKNAQKNNENIPLDAPAQVIKGKTYVPLSFITANLNIPVQYDNVSKTVFVGDIDLYAPPIPVNPGTPQNDNSGVVSDKEQNAKQYPEDNKHVVTNSEKEGVWIKGNMRSHIYHLPGGKHYYKVSAHNIVWFQTEEEAQAAGYRRAVE